MEPVITISYAMVRKYIMAGKWLAHTLNDSMQGRSDSFERRNNDKTEGAQTEGQKETNERLEAKQADRAGSRDWKSGKWRRPADWPASRRGVSARAAAVHVPSLPPQPPRLLPGPLTSLDHMHRS